MVRQVADVHKDISGSQRDNIASSHLPYIDCYPIRRVSITKGIVCSQAGEEGCGGQRGERGKAGEEG